MFCPHCGQPHADNASYCGHCGHAIHAVQTNKTVPPSHLYLVKNQVPPLPAKMTMAPSGESQRLVKTHQKESVTNITSSQATAMSGSMSLQSFTDIIHYLSVANPLRIRKGHFTRLTWFILANAAIAISVSIISGGELVQMVPYLIALSSIFPFFMLLMSRSLAISSHHIALIDHTIEDPMAKNLYATVTQLATRAGLKKTPQVGIYDSADMNAFATGFSRHHALVAFSTGLLQSLEDKSIAAVAAHEISHIANGDMVTMALVQSVVNTIINLITIPLKLVNLIAIFDRNIGAAAMWLVFIFRWVLTVILIFFGSLVLHAFSRHREFKADALAARLLDKEAMIIALEELSHDTVRTPKSQTAYASFKINSTSRLWDIFSTHPSIGRRIKALQKLK